MYILGLSCFRDDASAALLKDGSIVGIAEEERFNRVKHAVLVPKGQFVTSMDESHGLRDLEIRFFPINSINFLLRQAGINIDAIDYIAYDFDHQLRIDRFDEYLPVSKVISESDRRELISCWKYWRMLLTKFAERASAQLVYVPHHLAHASGTVFASAYDSTNYLVIDGLGELTSATFGSFDGKFAIHKNVPLPHSLGLAYAAVTKFLGFRPFSDEQKTMALAGYGEDLYRSQLQEIAWISDNGFETNPDFIWTDDIKMELSRPSKLKCLFGVPPRGVDTSPLEGEYPHIACSLQRQLERIVLHMVRLLYGVNPSERLCMAGGVALNCQLNGKIAQLPFIKSLFIQPQAGDAGAALGAAYYTYNSITGLRPEPLYHAYWGSGYGSEEVHNILHEFKLPHFRPENPIGMVAQMLSEGKVIGFYQGRSECGPRALGNRSILANPGKIGIDKLINAQIKNREKWQPFAASILNEYRKEYLRFDLPSPYMLLSLPLTERGKRDLIAASHIDGTTRPQLVDKQTNPRLYELLCQFKLMTGIGALLNTSFNLKGEPIVENPIEAIRDYYLSGLDALLMEDFLLVKESL